MDETKTENVEMDSTQISTHETKNILEFVSYLCQLEPIEFSGIMYMLDIQVVEEDRSLRSFEELLSEAIDKFMKIGRRQKRDIIKVIKATVKQTKALAREKTQ